jgi:predicted HTH domain antitoxin
MVRASFLRTAVTGCTICLTDPIMEAVPGQLDQDLVELLEELQRPAKKAARELIVLELYRQGEVSSGRAAQLLGMEREGFIRYASEQGIPYLQLEGDELQRELDAIKKL